MAGLLLKELKYRGLAKRILVVVPPSLINQWADSKEGELAKKFSEQFTIINSATMHATAGRNIWEEYDQCVTSVDFAKREDVRQSLQDVQWDLVIVDEAHKLAAYMNGKKTTKTDRYLLGEILSRNSEHILFLTATPHRGNPENFRLLLSLLDPDLYANEEILKQAIEKDENKIFLRRLKEDMIDWNGKRLFPPRHAHTMDYALSEDELRLYDAVTAYIKNSFARLKPGEHGMAFGLMVLQRRLASSVRAIRKSLERKIAHFEDCIATGQMPVSSTPIEEPDEDDSDEDTARLEESAATSITGAKTIDDLRYEVTELRQLVALAKEVEKGHNETKLEELRKVLEETKLRESKDEKLLIFTEHKDTLDYLVEKLHSWGLTTAEIHGMMSMDERVQAQRDFKSHAQVMVATEAAGEGINLQFCKLMINYDLPWNPNRLEQRMGRIHRYGQTHEVHIYNFVASNTMEGQVMAKVLEKLEIMRRHLGSDRVYDVMGEVLQGVNLQQHLMDLILERRTLEQINKELTQTISEEDVQKARDASQEALCTRFIDLTQLRKESQYAKEQRLVPEYIERFFIQAYEKLGGKIRKLKPFVYRIESPIPYNIRHNKEARKRFGDLKDSYPKISFMKELKDTEDGVEILSPGNPLFESVVENIFKQYSSLLMRGATFSDPSGGEGTLYFYRGGVVDGRGNIVGERLFGIFEKTDGSFESKNPFILWDLKDARSESIPSVLNEEKGIEYAFSNVLEPYFEEMKERREHDVNIKQKYVKRSLDYITLQKSKQISKLNDKFKAGMAQPIEKQTLERYKREKDEIIRRQELRLKELAQELHLSLSKPELVAVVLVKPLVLEEKEMDFMHRDPEVEKAAMDAAMAFEEKQGRTPQDVSALNLGFDIRSSSQNEVRCIEVKGRAGVGPVALTVNEWIKANRFGDAFWLYIVTNAKTTPELHLIQNPAQCLKPMEEEKIVRYVVAYQAWKNAEQIM